MPHTVTYRHVKSKRAGFPFTLLEELFFSKEQTQKFTAFFSLLPSNLNSRYTREFQDGG
jgi:hypothetical protein